MVISAVVLPAPAIPEENTVRNSTTRVRGLDSADNTRDYFLTNIPWDAFDVGRVDLQRGPNSILFGTGSPAGIINVSTNAASFTNSYNFTNRVDNYAVAPRLGLPKPGDHPERPGDPVCCAGG